MNRFTNPRKVSVLILFFLALLACEEPIEKAEPIGHEDQKIQLGPKGPNPFSSDNMNQALKSLISRLPVKSGKTNVCYDCIPSTTHNYVRFAPQDVDQLITLHNWGYDLYDVPLDQEITTSGEYYQDPSLPDDAITYQYTLVPANYSLPTSVPYRIITQVLLFDETAGDEQDEIVDPWIPDPPPEGNVCYDEFGSAYICGTSPRAYLRTSDTEKRPEDLYRKATSALLNEGINLVELYNEAMRLAGLPDEMIPASSANAKTQGYHPSGYIKVVDDLTGMAVPVRNITVKTRRWFKIDETTTDPNGYYAINKSYRQKANVVLKFRNNFITIRGISGAFKVWEYAQALEKELGLYSSGQVNVTLPYVANADTYGALQWAAAHAMNTHYDMKQYSTANALPGPYSFLNVWITSAWTRAASASMLRALIHEPVKLNDVLNFMLAPSPQTVAPFIRKMFTNWLPDITMRLQQVDTNGNPTGNTRRAPDLSNTFFHEFGHSQHYSQVGDGYWIIEIGNTILKGGYGTKTSAFGPGRTAVVESWGYFIGNTFNETKYRSILRNTAATVRANQDRDQLENQVPNDTNWQGWIPFGALHDMRDTGEPAFTTVVDNVSGYSMAGLFKGFQSNVTTVQELRQEILSRNGNSQLTQVNQLITSYRW
jgi:hypothetical protein